MIVYNTERDEVQIKSRKTAVVYCVRLPILRKSADRDANEWQRIVQPL